MMDAKIPLSYEEIAEILGLIESIECDELLLEWEELRIHVVRGGSALVSAENDTAAMTSTSARAERVPLDGSLSGHNDDASEQRDLELDDAQQFVDTGRVDAVPIAAPMMGTFYRSPSPGEPPFVEEGDLVDIGETVAIIEVMKLMNRVEAQVRGKVTKIEVADGDLLEYAQPIMWVEPDG